MKAALVLMAALFGPPALADEIVLPAAALDRTGPVIALWRPSPPMVGNLQIDWTDSFGRLVEQHQVKVDPTSLEVPVSLDLRRTVAPDNTVIAHFQPDMGGSERRAETHFIARPAPGWIGYQVLMWQDETPAALAALRGLGVVGTKVIGPLNAAGQGEIQQRLIAGMRWYTENLATDFYASYHRWTAGRPVNWRFDAARALHQAAPGDPAAFQRVPSLSDPAWLDTITARLRQIAVQQAPYRPLFHNLADESGIGDLAAAWDFDTSPHSLAAMRAWLVGRYGTLTALNQAWGTQFTAWADVMPALTDAAVQSDASVLAWMDFKAWMDVAFARAVHVGAAAIHRGDPEALAALEGAQPPGWGGYDYGLLAGVVDVMEIYDSGNAAEIAQSFNPALRALVTSAQGGPAERHRLWHEWLLGGRGVVLWDEARDFMGENGQPGPRGVEMAPLLQTLGGVLGAQLADMAPAAGRVAILYSQASFRMQWLLDRRAERTPWTDRDAEAEFTGDNAWRAATRRAVEALAGLGAQPRWITPDMLVNDTLEQSGIRVLILPHSVALADADVAAIRRFAAAGGLVLADVPPGERDNLGRPRPALPLADLAVPGALQLPQALRGDGDDGLAEMAGLLAQAGAAAPLQLFDPDGGPARGLDIRLFRSGSLLLAGIQSRMAGMGERSVELRLPEMAWVQPLWGETPRRRTDRLTLQIGPIDPILLALSPRPLPTVTLSGPEAAGRGDLAEFRLGLTGASPATAHLVRLTVSDPQGHAMPLLAETVRVPVEGVTWSLRLALNDLPGIWQVQAADALGAGQTTQVSVSVH